MPVVSEVVGALGAGALVLVVARQLGIEGRRAFGAVALVPVAVAALLAVPALRDAGATLLDERDPLAVSEGPNQPGTELGINVPFFEWVETHLVAGDTFHLEIGRIPDETYVAGVGVRQAAILQWGLYQLAPYLAVEQSPKARDLEPGEGRNADWIVFYESRPADYPGPLGEVMTYAPEFAMARSRLAD